MHLIEFYTIDDGEIESNNSIQIPNRNNEFDRFNDQWEILCSLQFF